VKGLKNTDVKIRTDSRSFRALLLSVMLKDTSVRKVVQQLKRSNLFGIIKWLRLNDL